LPPVRERCDQPPAARDSRAHGVLELEAAEVSPADEGTDDVEGAPATCAAEQVRQAVDVEGCRASSEA
jgi:hypothetical protein